MPEFKKTVYVLIALIITGCGTAPKGEGPVFSFNPSKDGMGTVYHYRLERVYGGAMSYALYSNGEFVTRIGNGGYYVQYLKPDKYEYKKIERGNAMGLMLISNTISNNMAEAEHVYTLTVAPNKIYFLRWSHAGESELMQEEIALRELEGLKEFSTKEKRIFSDPAIPTSLE